MAVSDDLHYAHRKTDSGCFVTDTCMGKIAPIHDDTGDPKIRRQGPNCKGGQVEDSLLQTDD